MAKGHGRHNDSSQMKDLMQFDDPADKRHEEKHEHEREHDSKDGCGQAVSSGSGAVSRRRAAGDEPVRDDDASSCCQLDDLKRLPRCQKELGPLDFSRTHTVLVDPPTPVPRWYKISKHLSALAKKPTASVDDVEEAIIKYNPKYKGQWSFDALSKFVKCVPKTENYFCALFPKIAALALELPERVKKAIPLLQTGRDAAITLSQVQISCLLANAFFCTFPHRNATSSNAEYRRFPSINFNSLFEKWSERKKEKLRAIMHYFNVVTDEQTKPSGLVTFERRCLRDTEVASWRRCKAAMAQLHVASHGAIETEGTGMLQVDFASSWIGGGVLSSGLVQEEILFLMNPELIVARLFTEKLEDNECLIITGSQQFSCYSGFGDTFEFAGAHEDRLQRDRWARLERQVLAIDALHFKDRMEQYDMRKVTRELNKAYCGFNGHGHNEPAIATGKWGCGAFKGDPQLKAVIQLMAAARAHRGLAFFSFGDETLKRGLQQTHRLLVTEQTTVGKLYGLLEDYCAAQRTSRGSHVELFEFLRNTIRPSRSQL